MAPHIVLEEIGEPFELELVSSKGEREGAMTSTPAWRAINPKGRIPALSGVAGSVGGAPMLLTEVPAILVFLGMQHPAAALLPTDSAGHARCIEWMNWLSGNVHAMSYGQIWRTQRFSAEDSAIEGIRERGRAALAEQYAYIESILSDGRDWAIPSGYSVVDPYLLVFFQWGQRIGVTMRATYPNWSELTDRVIAREAVQRALAKENIVIT